MQLWQQSMTYALDGSCAWPTLANYAEAEFEHSMMHNIDSDW